MQLKNHDGRTSSPSFTMNCCARALSILLGVGAFSLTLMKPISLFAFHIPSIPIQDVKADSIEMRERKIYLTGSVKVTYDLGLISCDRAIIHLGEKSKDEGTGQSSQPDRIDLFGSLVIEMSDGSSLASDRGELFCKTREAVFYGNEREKVVYTSYCEEEGKKVAVQAKGKKITAKIVKDSSGKSTLSDIRGEGAVSIEYLR